MKKMELYKTIWTIVGAVGIIMTALSGYFVSHYSKKIKEQEKTETVTQPVNKATTASPTINVEGNNNKVESNNSSNTDNSSNKRGNSVVGNIQGNVTQTEKVEGNQIVNPELEDSGPTAVKITNIGGKMYNISISDVYMDGVKQPDAKIGGDKNDSIK